MNDIICDDCAEVIPVVELRGGSLEEARLCYVAFSMQDGGDNRTICMECGYLYSQINDREW